MLKPIKTFLLSVVLERAIKLEEDAFNFYSNQLDYVSDRKLRSLIKSFKEEALDHRMRLEDMQKEGNLVCMDLYQEDYKPEPPAEENAGRENGAGERDRRILESILEREKETREYYTWVAEKTKIDLVRDAFSCFVEEEEQRIEKLEKLRSDRSDRFTI